MTVSQESRRRWEAITAASVAGDFSPVTDLIDTEVEFHSRLAIAEGDQVYTGIEGLQRWVEDTKGTWEDWGSDVVDFHATGNEQTVAIHRVTGTAKGSGVPLDTRIGLVVTWRHGRARRIESYRDPQEALHAAGLA